MLIFPKFVGIYPCRSDGTAEENQKHYFYGFMTPPGELYGTNEHNVKLQTLRENPGIGGYPS